MITINCLVVDDEPLAREIIETYLSKLPGWQVAASCINAIEAYEAMMRTPVDVIFLDIQMPIISGIDFLRTLKQPPLIVFTTAYAEHAVTGFDLHAVDYLVKPISFERFFQATQKITERMQIKAPPAPLPPADIPTYFFIKLEGRLVKINYGDVLYMEAQRDFTTIHLANKKLLAGMHLKAIEDMLAPPNILRVHRSYIVNLDAIRAINGNVLEIAGTEIPIGDHYKESLWRQLGIK